MSLNSTKSIAIDDDIVSINFSLFSSVDSDMFSDDDSTLTSTNLTTLILVSKSIKITDRKLKAI